MLKYTIILLCILILGCSKQREEPEFPYDKRVIKFPGDSEWVTVRSVIQMRKELDELRATENAKLSWYIITPNGCFEYKTKEFAYKSLRNHPTATHVVHAVKLITVLNPAAAETTPSSIE